MGKYSDIAFNNTATKPTTKKERYSSMAFGDKKAPVKNYIENPYMQDTDEISTITGKPIQKPSSTDYKPADFKTLFKAGFVDNEDSVKKLFSDARGIPVEKYEVKDGRVYFQGNDGNMYPEAPKEALNLIKKLVAELPSEGLADIGASVGAVFGGIPGAAGGAGAGETTRKLIGELFLGDEQTAGDYAKDIGVQSVFGTLDATLAKKLTNILSSRKIKKNTGGQISNDFTNVVGDLSPEQRTTGQIVNQKAQNIGVDLKPHQAMDDPTLTGYYKLLRDNPKTARAVRKNDNQLDTEVQAAGEDLLKNISSGETDPFTVGSELQKAGTQAIENMKKVRGDAVKDLYDEANKVVDVDTLPALEELARLKKTVKPGMKAHSAIARLERMLVRKVETKRKNQFTHGSDPNGPTLDEIDGYLAEVGNPTKDADINLAKIYKKEDKDAYRQLKREAQDIVSSSGDFEDWKEIISQGGLNYETALMMSDKNTINELMKRRPGLFKKGAALHAEHFANEKGFDTPDELFQSWVDRKKRKDAIDDMTQDLFHEYQAGNDMGRAMEHVERLYNEELKVVSKRLSKTKPKGKNIVTKTTPESRLEVLDNVKQEIDAIIGGKDSSSITNKLKRKLMGVKDILTTQTDKKSREYQVARALFSAASPKITDTEKSIVGVLSRMTTDEIKEKAIKKIFASRQSIRKAKKHIEKVNPGLWQDAVAELFRDGFEKASKVAQGSGGKVLNRPGKYTSKMWDLSNQKKLKLATEGMKDGNGDPLYDRITDFFEVMQKASIGQGKESATQSRLKMEKELQGIPGKISATAMSLRQSVINFGLKNSQERTFDKNAKKLLELMQTPEGVELIATAKGYGPKTEKGMNAAATLLMMATETNTGKVKEIISTYQDQQPRP